MKSAGGSTGRAIAVSDRWRGAVAALVLLGAWATPSTAGATQNFPTDVQNHYMLTSVAVDPPQGCMLCHVDDTGGTQSTLRPFGRLMLSLHVAPYDDGSVEAALAVVDSQYPTLAADIVSGRDPNTDVGAPKDPVPAYGCAFVGAGAGTDGTAGVAVFALGALALVRRDRSFGRQLRPKRRTRPSHPRAR